MVRRMLATAAGFCWAKARALAMPGCCFGPSSVNSALGTTSARTWLKMPSCDDPEVVFGATTLPCVVLGGVPGPDPAADLASWGRTLLQPVVRGLVVGRALLYPPDGDVAGAVAAAARVLASSAGPELVA